MKLNLSISGKIVASVPVNSHEAENEYYLKALRRLLVMRYKTVLKAAQKEPDFFVEIPGVGKSNTLMLNKKG